MFDVILKATNSSFQKRMIFCRTIYVKKVMKLLAFIFEQPSYMYIIRIYHEREGRIEKPVRESPFGIMKFADW